MRFAPPTLASGLAPVALAHPSAELLAPPTAPVEPSSAQSLAAPTVAVEPMPDDPFSSAPGLADPPDEPVASILSDDARLALFDAMPVAVFLIDPVANVRFANLRTAQMIGLPRDEILGRNVLDFVSVDDLDFAADLLNSGGLYGGRIMGPSRVRYVDAAGLQHWTQVWAQIAPPELAMDGFIVTLTSESVRDVLATAVTSVAEDDELDRTLAAVALAARAQPICGRGAILIVEPASGDDTDRFRLIGNWPIDLASINAFGTPWRQAFVEARTIDVDDVAAAGLTPAARDMLLVQGIEGLFVRPIFDVAREVIGIFVVFRDDRGVTSPNQNDHLEEAVRLAGLAFGQAQRRAELETAAHRDALTGIPNRAAFNERLHTERRAIDVLFVDLDHFKSVNDTFGHETGDIVIATAAKRIAETVRRTDTVYRTGGDEFVIFCEPSGDDQAERIRLAERIIEHLMAPFDVGPHRVRVGATVGIAAGGDRPIAETLRAADRALYLAKERGRACWAHDHD